LVRTFGCRHAGNVAMFGLEGHLMVAIFQVEHAPDFAVTLFLENVFDTQEGMSIFTPRCRLPFESPQPSDSRWVFS
jgi:hypothetical protein